MTGSKFVIFALCLVLFLACSDIDVIDPYTRDGAPVASSSSSELSSSSEIGNIGICNGKEYNTTLYNCVMGEIVGSCKGVSYYPEYQRCENGIIIDGAEISSSSTGTQSSSSSSSYDASSSSSPAQCSGFVNGTTRPHYGKDKAQFCDERDGKKYVYVSIGGRDWMAENLNYDADGSKCYDNSEPNCDTYGRLYNWDKATNACPFGWNLPSDAEWDALTQAVGGTTSPNYLTGAATPLKAASIWNTETGSIIGTDVSGFTALPGGIYASNGNFSNVYDYGNWWSATEYDAGNAYRRIMGYNSGNVSRNYNDKTRQLSVRCIKSLCSGFVNGTTRPHYGKDKAQFCDERDGKKYVYVPIGGKNWMAENLNYNAYGSKCYDNCNTYGRSYNWNTAINNVCPQGWHLPSDAEWNTLTQAVGGTGDNFLTGAAKPLKTIEGWDKGNGYIAGTDLYGFSALPGGFTGTDDQFLSVTIDGFWWSSTKYNDDTAYARFMRFWDSDVGRVSSIKVDMFSVRCVED